MFPKRPIILMPELFPSFKIADKPRVKTVYFGGMYNFIALHYGKGPEDAYNPGEFNGRKISKDGMPGNFTMYKKYNQMSNVFIFPKIAYTDP